jgi:LysR family transcriptional repressor of citA
MHLSQPSVSVRIRLLQEELGVKLFEQTGKKISLTEGGLVLERKRQTHSSGIPGRSSGDAGTEGVRARLVADRSQHNARDISCAQLVAEFKRQHPKIEVYVAIERHSTGGGSHS